jgi:parallel beta-helix repeat protein
MKVTGRRYNSPLILAIVLIFFALPMMTGMQTLSVASLEPAFQPSQTPHGPITITSNADFAAQAAAEIWPGSGELFDPYIISGLSIINDLTCISIENVDVYFEIRNCYLESVWGGDRYGVSIENSEHGTVEGCTIRRAGRGINVDLSSAIAIVDNDVGGSMRRGISVLQSSFCEVTGNEVHGNEDGITLSYSSNCIVRFNTAYSNYESGFHIYQTDESIFLNNTSGYHTDHGYKIESSINCTFSRNVAFDNYLDGFILNESVFCVLESNTAEDNLWGFSSGGAYGCVLEDNLARHNTALGFNIDDSPYTLLQDNIAYHNSDSGIRLDSSLGSLLIRNKVYNNSDNGIEVFNVNLGTVSDNEVFYNNNDGIYFNNADNLIVSLNIVRNNHGCGFTFSGVSNSDNCTVIRNVAMYNDEYGIHFTERSSTSLLHRNLFGWNAIGNALDYGISNSWDDEVDTGNAWSDYGGTGTYPVPGNASAIDHYPIGADLSSPSVDTPDDLSYEVGEVGNRIEWDSYSIIPRYYEITRNGTLVDSGDWNGSALAFNVDGLSFGSHNFTIRVVDIFGNYAIDTVFVVVSVPTQITEYFGIPTQTLIMIGIGAAVLIAAIIIQQKKELYD